MIREKSDYRFVTEDALANIAIQGKPYPIRMQKLILKGEDVAFLEEAVRERNAVFGTVESYKGRIRTVVREIAGQFYGKIKDLLIGKDWFDKDKFENMEKVWNPIHVVGEYNEKQENEIKETVRRFYESYLEEKKRREEKAEENKYEIAETLQTSVKAADKILKEGKNAAKTREFNKTKAIEEELDTEIKRIDKQRTADLDELSEQLSRAQTPDAVIRIQWKITRKLDEYVGKFEDTKAIYGKQIDDLHMECQNEIANLTIEHDDTVFTLKKKAKEKTDKIDEKLKKQNADAEYRTAKTVYKILTDNVVYSREYGKSPDEIDYEREVEDAHIVKSCADAYYAKRAYDPFSSTPLNRIFADLERLRCVKIGLNVTRESFSVKWNVRHSGFPPPSISYKNVCFYDIHGTNYRWNCPGSSITMVRKHTDVNTRDHEDFESESTELQILFGNRKTEDLIEAVYADVELVREETLIYLDENGLPRTDVNSEIAKSIYIVRVKMTKKDGANKDIIDRVDDLDDKWESDEEKYAESHQDRIDAINDEYEDSVKELTKTYDDNCEAAVKRMDTLNSKAQESYFRTASAGIGETNKSIRNAKKNEERISIRDAYMNDTVQNAENTYALKVDNNYTDMKKIVSNLEKNLFDNIAKLDKNRGNKITKENKSYSDAYNSRYRSYSKRRQKILEEIGDRIKDEQDRHADALKAAATRYGNACEDASKKMNKKMDDLVGKENHDGINPTDVGWSIINRKEGNKRKYESIKADYEIDMLAADNAYNAETYQADKSSFAILSKMDRSNPDARCKWVGKIQTPGKYELSPRSYFTYYGDFKVGNILRTIVVFKPKTLTGVNFADYYKELEPKD